MQNFYSVIKSIVERSGGSMDKINLQDFMSALNDSLSPALGEFWLGIKIQKIPPDLMILQEIIFDRKPDTIIECGTAFGGSAYFMATIMDLMNIDGKIITIDHQKYPPEEAYPKKDLIKIDGKIVAVDIDLYQVQTRPKHPKIEYIHSDCLTAAIPKLGSRTMLVLDCDHSADHVYKELKRFSSMVTSGQYIIVEDTDLDGVNYNGPKAAIQKFLKKNKNFITDKNREKYGVSRNLGGYLLKIS